MQKRSVAQAWKVALAVIALMATCMALYVHLFERRSRQEEDRLAAARLEAALEGARARLKAELLAELREELAKSEGGAGKAGQPLPGAVLRRSESATDRALQQGLAAGGAEKAALDRLEDRLDSFARQMDESDRTLRLQLEEARAGSRREQAITAKILSLLLVALSSLVLVLVISLLEGRRAGRAEAQS
jgi:hypothetical protein